MPRPAPARLTLAAAALVALAAAALFAPALGHGWLFWDDRLFVADNPNLVFSAAGLRWMAGAFYGGAYQPLPYLSFALDRLLWGADPRGYHLTSVLLHALNAALVFFLARALLRRARPDARPPALTAAAALGALLFAAHPLRVESVAWISERRQLFAAALYLSAALAYLRAQERGPRRRWLALSAALILLSAFAKALAITAPLVLIALDWYPLRRLPEDPLQWRRGPRAVWLEKLPFVAASAVAAALGWLAQRRGHAVWTLSEHSVPARLAQAFYGLAFYARKTVWPASLSPFYDMSAGWSPLQPRFWLSAAAVLLAFAWAWRLRRAKPQWLCALAVYALLLAPVLGLTQSGLQLVADRYSYLSCLPLALLAAGGWLALAGRGARTAASALAGAAVLCLCLATRRQLPFWRDSTALWSRAVALQPDSAFARNNLGFALAQEGRLDDAAAQFQAAIAADPDCAQPLTRRGKLCAEAQANLAYTRKVQAQHSAAASLR